MKFCALIMTLLLNVQGAAAFSPARPLRSSISTESNVGATPVRRPSFVQMVAGGAERAYQDEYYDGKIRCQ